MVGKHRAKRISERHYIYRGFHIYGMYYHPEHRVCWEAVDQTGCGFAHSFSLRETKQWVDYELDVDKRLPKQ